MATITTDTYFDAAARTAGEGYTINGATLTVRTDTRWHAGAPASMTGTISNINTSATLGGKFKIDGTKVRWMAFDTGTGTVPAIGTTITQGGVSGYLLGVWTGVQGAPTAVGAAMPASGFLKFREVTGGTFSVGALTGISANASSADVTGWIEVAFDQSTSANMNNKGEFEAIGDWFYLDTTSGSRQQQIQIPSTSSTGHVYGIQIETSPGSNVYEWYAGGTTAQWFLTTIVGTDARSKCVCSSGANPGISVAIIGGDGTNSIGNLPAAGCKIRIPNIIIRHATTAARATNAYVVNSVNAPTILNCKSFTFKQAWTDQNPSNWTNFGSVDIDNAVFDGISNSFTNLQNYFYVRNTLFSLITTGTFTTSNRGARNIISGATFENVYYIARDQGASGFSIRFEKSKNLTINGLKIFNALVAGSRQSYTGYASQSGSIIFDAINNSSISGLSILGCYPLYVGCNELTISNTDFCHATVGNNTTSPNLAGAVFQLCGNMTISGYSVGLNGTIANQNPYSRLFSIVGTLGFHKFRNIGSSASYLNLTGTNNTTSVFDVLAGASNVSIKRCYFTMVTSVFVVANLSNQYGVDNLVIENVYTNTKEIFRHAVATNVKLHGNSGTFTYGTYPGLLGVHWGDIFESSIAGSLIFQASAPSTSTADFNTVTGTASFNYGAGMIDFVSTTTPDIAYSEMEYFAKGYTAFANTAPTISGTNPGYITIEYQIDTGSGYNGTWKTLDTTNLTAETISPSTGFKLKLRMTKATNDGTLARIEYIRIRMTTTSVAQNGNFYALDTNTLSFTGLATGSEVRCYTGTDPSTAVEIGGTESTAGSTFSFTHSSGGVEGYIMILAMGYQPVYLPYTYKSTDDSILIQPVVDRNYVNPA